MTLEELYELRRLLFKLEDVFGDETEEDERTWEKIRDVDHICCALVEDMGGDVDVQ